MSLTPKVTYEGISKAETDLVQMECDYLRQRGWSFDQENWMRQHLWRRALPDGTVVLMDRKSALSAQYMMDHLTKKEK
jgi:hypothetical protein